MYKGKKILATICARGGSKGVKHKNIKPLGGKPLIEYSLEIATASELVDKYIVSTDSDVIIDKVKELGYKIEFERPAHLAGDEVSRIDAIQHAVNWVEETYSEHYDYIVDLGVATPFKSLEDLEGAIKLCIDSEVENVFSVCPSIKNPYFNMVEEENGVVQLVKDSDSTARQQAPEVYEMNDGFNVWERRTLFAENPQFNPTTKMYIMPRERSIDIDEQEDFVMAEFKLNQDKND